MGEQPPRLRPSQPDSAGRTAGKVPARLGRHLRCLPFSEGCSCKGTFPQGRLALNFDSFQKETELKSMPPVLAQGMRTCGAKRCRGVKDAASCGHLAEDSSSLVAGSRCQRGDVCCDVSAALVPWDVSLTSAPTAHLSWPPKLQTEITKLVASLTRLGKCSGDEVN